LISISASLLFSVLGILGFTGRDLATRSAPKILSNIELGVYGFFILMPTGLIILFFNDDFANMVLPSSITSLQILGTIVFGSTAYYSLTVAMRIGEVSVVTPFRYTRLVFALLIGVTLLGSAIVIASGIYTLLINPLQKKNLFIYPLYLKVQVSASRERVRYKAWIEENSCSVVEIHNAGDDPLSACP
jgi:drug/metabolite transporter (DMT)-like permease